MRNIYIFIIPLLFSAVFITTFSLLYNNIKRQPQLCFENACFLVEIAKTAEQRAQGLMRRERLDSHRGMLFIFDNEDFHSFWMKNTKIPLDIVWLNKNLEVAFIKNNASPCLELSCPKIMPETKAKYVLEINASLAEKLNIKLYDKAVLK